MYKVDVADKAIPKMLDWDKPIAEQKNLMNLLKKDAKKDSWVRDFLEMDLKDEPYLKGKDLYDKLKYKFNINLLYNTIISKHFIIIKSIHNITNFFYC